MKFDIEKITPQRAAEYLKRNKVNRLISHETVNKYADDMKNGAFQCNGEAIKFNKSGALVDGQHRLRAIIKSGVTVEVLVIREVDDSVSIYDLARSRSPLDSLIIEGYDRELANVSNVALARLHAIISRGSRTISTSEIRKFLNEHRDALLTIAPVRKKGHTSGIAIKAAPILLAMMYAVEAGEKHSKILEFADVLASGFYSKDSQTAAIVLRNDILTGKIDVAHGITSRVMATRCIENAINDFCRERPRKRSYMKSATPIYEKGVAKDDK